MTALSLVIADIFLSLSRAWGLGVPHISATSDDQDTPTNGDSSNISTAISPPPYWSGETFICSVCNKIILNKFLSLHSDKCEKLPSLDSYSPALRDNGTDRLTGKHSAICNSVVICFVNDKF